MVVVITGVVLVVDVPQLVVVVTVVTVMSLVVVVTIQTVVVTTVVEGDTCNPGITSPASRFCMI